MFSSHSCRCPSLNFRICRCFRLFRLQSFECQTSCLRTCSAKFERKPNHGTFQSACGIRSADTKLVCEPTVSGDSSSGEFIRLLWPKPERINFKCETCLWNGDLRNSLNLWKLKNVSLARKLLGRSALCLRRFLNWRLPLSLSLLKEFASNRRAVVSIKIF